MRRRVAILLGLLAPLLLSGCAALAPTAPPPGPEIFRDELFAPAPPAPDPQSLFALSPAMRDYIAERIQPQVRRKGAQQALLDALYTQGELRLEYDASRTRTAAEAFEARHGNCLSLVIMTAAFAQELGLKVRFQDVQGAPAVERNGDLTFLIGHVNLALGSGVEIVRPSMAEQSWLIIDFLPGQDLRRQRWEPLDEHRVRAMFMNNRAAEEMALGRVREAYWWARAAWAQDAGFANLYNTLGVIYRRAGALPEAERAFRVAQAMDPGLDTVAGNLAGVLQAMGRSDEAQRVAGAQPPGPPAPTRVEQARRLLDGGDTAQALRVLQAELGLTPRNPELHHALAQAHAQQGDLARARRHLELAADYSAAGEQHRRYAGKLERLKAQLQ